MVTIGKKIRSNTLSSSPSIKYPIPHLNSNLQMNPADAMVKRKEGRRL
jgi:hypothetical protein